ncbi:MAG: BTAD domain-containing putative transcriptional regulator [Pseudomonadota bacterium]
MVRLRLLGRLDVERGDGETHPIPLSCAPLVAYLLCHRDGPVDRNQAATVLWPDRPEHRAKRCLATALWRLRRVSGLEDWLDTGLTNRVRIDPDSAVAVDIVEFEDALTDFLRQRSDATETQMARALDATTLYLRDAFDQIDAEWIYVERERLRQLLVDGLGQLARNFEARQKTDRMIEIAERLVRLEPLREDVHRLLMRGYLARGARAKAIAQYRICQGELADALGIEPMAETQSLYQDLVARIDRKRAPSSSTRSLEIARAVARRLGHSRKTVDTLGSDLDEALSLLDRLPH